MERIAMQINSQFAHSQGHARMFSAREGGGQSGRACHKSGNFNNATHLRKHLLGQLIFVW